MAEVLEKVYTHFNVRQDAEISIEANPGTVDLGKLAVYRQAGINRISFGCQSGDNRELKLLGRIHTWEEFLESFSMAREAGFSNINVDLMSGLPGQSLASWEDSLYKRHLQAGTYFRLQFDHRRGNPFCQSEAGTSG